jgi:hypothetical protein
MSDDTERTRFVPLEADTLGVLALVNGVPYLCIGLTAGCDCHPEHTLFVERRHCLN